MRCRGVDAASGALWLIVLSEILLRVAILLAKVFGSCEKSTNFTKIHENGYELQSNKNVHKKQHVASHYKTRNVDLKLMQKKLIEIPATEWQTETIFLQMLNAN